MPKFCGEKVLMRIFVGEGDTYGRKPLYEALIDLLIAEGFAGATVLRGVAGFGPTASIIPTRCSGSPPTSPLS